MLSFDDDLEERLAEADAWSADFTQAIDAHISRESLDAPEAVPEEVFAPAVGLSQLDLRRAGVRSVVWCTGYRLDYAWVNVPVFDVNGKPVQRRGVTAVRGLYFLGLHWMHSFYSSTLFGVGEDAGYIADHMNRGVRA